MRLCLTAAIVLAVTGALSAAEPPTVLPAVVYRDNLFTHYRDARLRAQPYLIAVRPLNDFSIQVTVNVAPVAANRFESLFVRNKILAFGANNSTRTVSGGSGSLDGLSYFSPDRLREAHLIALAPDGQQTKPAPVQGGHPTVWSRYTKLPIFGGAPGTSEIRHTAVAATGDRDVLVFDLTRTIPEEGKAELPLRLAITRVVPDAIKPEEKSLGELRAEFSEPFQAYVIGDDYYFLTHSGTVYRSIPPAKDQPRTMTAVWGNPNARVRFIISDGNRTGVHFLITPHEKGGWAYSRLGPDPRPQALTTDREETDPLEVVFELAGRLKEKKEIVTAP